ncbi:MAG: hypothetical protein J6X08_05380, partial [Lachnospiraceae bacterium]|nr:hypothetical protein [Lachnospiraceae bacterium]
MNGEKDFYDSFDNYWGKEKQESEPVQYDSRPTKFRTLYMITIVQIILIIIGVIAALFKATALAQISILATLVAGIAYLVVVMMLREYNDLFKTAGWFYLSKTLIDFFNDNFKNGPFYNIIEVAVAALNILYITKFCDACALLLK